jgi:hypothetical protein
MKIYHYHPQTSIYLGTNTAEESPLEPGKYLIPAHATTLMPPSTTERKQIVWKDNRWEVFDILKPESPPEIKAPPITWEIIRAQRNEFLRQSDWTQLPDAPLTKEQNVAWKTYRQSLRDIPNTFSTPESVKWPEAPLSSL